MSSTSISEEMRAAVGRESQPQVLGQVYQRDINRFVQATGEQNPIYNDETYAKKGPYNGIVAPPLFIFTFGYQAEGAKLNEDGRAALENGIVPRIPGSRVLGGGSELEFLIPLRPGDIVSAKKKVLDIYEKQGKTGMLIFIITQTTYMNQHNELVAVEKGTQILRGGNGEN